MPLRLFDHQMDIQGQSGNTPNRLYHQRPHGNVGDEMAIHYIDMDIIRAPRFCLKDLPAQVSKVSRQDGRCNLDMSTHALSSAIIPVFA
jgi:hypothetical protein